MLVHGSLLHATDPRRFPSRVGAYFAHPAKHRCGFATADNDLGKDAAVLGRCPHCSVQERKEHSCALNSCQYRLPAAVEKREAFGLACRHVRERQGVQVPSLCLDAAMSHQVCFQKAGLRFIPVLRGADGNLVFEQGSCSRGGHSLRMLLSRGAEKAISCRGAYGEQLVATLLREMQMPMPLQRSDQGGEEGDQSFGTDLIGRFPGQEQGLLYFWSIIREMCPLTAWFRLLWMVEEVNGIFTHVAGDGDECIQHQGLACA